MVQQVQDTADVAVDTLDRSQVLPGPLLDPRDIDVVVGGLGDLGVQVLERGPVFRTDGQPRGVRCAEVRECVPIGLGDGSREVGALLVGVLFQGADLRGRDPARRAARVSPKGRSRLEKAEVVGVGRGLRAARRGRHCADSPLAA